MAVNDNGTLVTTKTKKKQHILKRLFKRKKKLPDDESVYTATPPAPSTSTTKIDQKIFLNGNSAAPHPPALTSIHENDGGGGGNSAAPGDRITQRSNALRIVLLLVDPTSHRFELLQLEFDATKATVGDVLHQVPQSASEPSFRDMAYAGVCNQEGTEMIAVMKLALFCRGEDVVIAIPSGMTASDTAKLAEPILFDPKVERMLPIRTSKIMAKQARMIQYENAKLSKISEVSSPRSVVGSIGGESTTKLSSFNLPTVILGVLLSSLMYYTLQLHVRLTRPLEPGSVLLLGQWKSQCGMFDLLPEMWLTRLIPMDKLLPSCNISSSSMLEFGMDGTLRYYTKGTDGQRKESWYAVSGTGDKLKCSQEGGDQCMENGAIFKEGIYNWYVVMGGTRHALSSDVARDFMAWDITRER